MNNRERKRKYKRQKIVVLVREQSREFWKLRENEYVSKYKYILFIRKCQQQKCANGKSLILYNSDTYRLEARKLNITKMR